MLSQTEQLSKAKTSTNYNQFSKTKNTGRELIMQSNMGNRSRDDSNLELIQGKLGKNNSQGQEIL